MDLPSPVDYQIIIFAVFSIFIALSILGTCLELKSNLLNKTDKEVRVINATKAEKSLLAFSIVSNTIRALLDTTSRRGVIECLNGVRFLSMAWVVLGHTFAVMSTSFFPSNPVKVTEILSSWTVLPVFNGTFSVDTFFMMSGLLVTYVLLKQLDKSGGKFSIFQFYLHRYVRLTPPYAIMMAFTVGVLPLMGTAPAFQATSGVNAARMLCDKWWSHLLYIRNLMWYETMTCMSHGWYLHNDMQFYLFAPLIVLPLYHFRHSKLFSHGYLLSWILASIGSTAAVLYARNVSGIYEAFDFLVPDRRQPDFVDRTDLEYYTKPWCRFGPYVVGMYAGYLLHQWKDRRPKLPALFVLTMWLLVTALTLAVIFGPERYMLFPEDLESAERMPFDLNVWYSALSRNAWAFSIAWIVIACHLGYGGPIANFLSWKAFKPLSNLSYSGYLVHIAILMHMGYNKFATYGLDISSIAFSFVGVLTFTYVVAYPLAMVFELPFVRLEKIWLTGGKQENKVMT